MFLSVREALKSVLPIFHHKKIFSEPLEGEWFFKNQNVKGEIMPIDHLASLNILLSTVSGESNFYTKKDWLKTFSSTARGSLVSFKTDSSRF